MIRWLGFILVFSGGAATGILMAHSVRRKLEIYRELISALELMRGEIEFRLTPLGEICKQLSSVCKKPLSLIFSHVADDFISAPGRPSGVQMRRALRGQTLPEAAKVVLTELFDSFGKQDIYAQLRAIDLAERRIQLTLDELQREKKERCQTYRTIGVCTGLAVAVILF